MFQMFLFLWVLWSRQPPWQQPWSHQKGSWFWLRMQPCCNPERTSCSWRAEFKWHVVRNLSFEVVKTWMVLRLSQMQNGWIPSEYKKRFATMSRRLFKKKIQAKADLSRWCFWSAQNFHIMQMPSDAVLVCQSLMRWHVWTIFTVQQETRIGMQRPFLHTIHPSGPTSLRVQFVLVIAVTIDFIFCSQIIWW